jgi:hypothetical protein
MNKKWLTLTASMLFFASAIFSQTLFDGLDYPFGDKGYNIAGEEYSIAEQINAAAYTVIGYTNIEINEMYPDFVSTTPNRGSTTAVSWYNASDVGDWASSGGKGGIHPGEDWNYGTVLQDLDTIVFTPATGIVWHYRQLSSPIATSAWAMVIMCVLPTGDSIFIPLCHVTSLTSPPGTICASASDFGFAIGDTVYRGQPVAKIANISGNASHLHLEIRTKFDISDPFWPNGPGGRYPKNDAAYQFGISMEKVAQAYYLMESDGIIDASDFIDTHRPSLYEEPAPEIEWQNTITGNDYDILSSVEQTSDGGYILAGMSNSAVFGDKTEACMGGVDYWIIKLNSTGIIEWQNTIGGNQPDVPSIIKQTSDGGYIVGGYTYTSENGDVTESNLGGTDIWIVKLNSIGAIEWQNTIGGNNNDNLSSLAQTSEGGYIVGCSSISGISGDKNEANIGLWTFDYWILKLDISGNIEWQNTIGGENSDLLTTVEQVSDGGYIIGGYSDSGISGDKSETSYGGSDYWVLKLNQFGNIEWQNTIGGDATDFLYSTSQTSDGGYILGGYSNSSISGDKTEANIGDLDYWITKLNSTGVIEWQNTIGGTGQDAFTTLHQTQDSGYILGGFSSSPISGDKTESNYASDYWIVKTTEEGALDWQTTIGGTGYDYLSALQETSDGGYILGGYSASGISGDKTEIAMGVADYWIVKLAGNCSPTTEICNGIDDNCDGLIDNDIIVTIDISAGGPTTFCQGGSVVLTATHSGESIQWKKNEVYISGATSSTYTATTSGMYSAVTTSACGAATSAGINVVANKNPTATITAGGPTTFCSGGSVVLTANAGGGLSYQWYKGAATIAGATNINYTATTTGNYKCRVTKTATGCFKNSNTISVSVTCKSGVDGFENISIYPNPASSYLEIHFDETISDTYIVIVNSLGQIVWKELVVSVSTEINISSFANGLYTINLLQNGNVIHSEKIIIE